MCSCQRCLKPGEVFWTSEQYRVSYSIEEEQHMLPEEKVTLGREKEQYGVEQADIFTNTLCVLTYRVIHGRFGCVCVLPLKWVMWPSTGLPPSSGGRTATRLASFRMKLVANLSRFSRSRLKWVANLSSGPSGVFFPERSNMSSFLQGFCVNEERGGRNSVVQVLKPKWWPKTANVVTFCCLVGNDVGNASLSVSWAWPQILDQRPLDHWLLLLLLWQQAGALLEAGVKSLVELKCS